MSAFQFVPQPSVLPDVASGLPLFTFDVTTSEQTESTAEVTEFPVEIGADISDHVRTKPSTVTLVGEITMTPLVGDFAGPLVLSPPFAGPQANLAAPFEMMKDAARFGPPVLVISPQQFIAPKDPVKDAETILLAIRDARTFCTVNTTSAEHTDMVLTSVSVHRESVGRAEFTLTFKQVNTVTSLTVAAPKPLIPAGKPKVSGGSPTPTAAPPDVKKTALKLVTDGAASLLP